MVEKEARNLEKKMDIDLNLFFKIVENKYSYIHDNCEMETTIDAMRSYLQYPIYKNWNIGNHNDSTGEWKLIRGNDEMTGDILTSIKPALINSDLLSEKELKKIREKGVTGPHIVNAIADSKYGSIRNKNSKGRKAELKIDSKYIKQIKSFAIVSYWIGNMMPVPKNPGGGRSGISDNIYSKMKLILDIWDNEEVVEEHKELKKMLYEWKEKQKEFIEGNYLQDLFDYDYQNKKYIVKKPQEDKAEWFIDVTKIIVCRSYRIAFHFNGSWDDDMTHKEYINMVFSKVFSQAGYNNNEIKKMLLVISKNGDKTNGVFR